MSDGLRIELSQVDGVEVTALGGSIDERCDLVEWARTRTGPLTLDLEGVEFINSEGVSRWVRFLADATPRGPVVIRRASEPMVALFNMVTDAVLGAVVETILATYTCLHCRAEHSVELDVAAELAADRAVMPARACPTCQTPMIFDGLTDRYLAFLGHD